MKKQMPKALKKTLSRAEMPQEYQWDLSPLYTSVKDWENELKACKEMLEEVKNLLASFTKSAPEMLACLRYRERFERALEKVYLFAALKKDEDNTNAQFVALKDRAQSLLVQAGTAFAWFAPAILSLPEETIKAWIEEPGFADYRKTILDIVKHKPHIRSEAEEEILAASAQLSNLSNQAFSMLNDADLRFPDAVDQDGESHTLTQSSFIKLMQDDDRVLRKSAFTNLYASYGKQKNTLAALLSGAVKRDCFYARMRHFSSALEAALFEEDIPTAVYDNLIATVRKELPILRRYLTLRKRMLELDELHMYDLYAPLVKESNKRIPYAEGVAMVQAGLVPLGEQYVADLTKGLRSGWVDVFENVGKTSGAYSAGNYDSNPYVLLNYQENLNSVFTLAHEMGHSMHSYYSHKNQPYPNAYYGIFLAEIASTVNENLLLQDLLHNAPDKREKIVLLNHFLEEFRATVFRQTMFAEFEKIIHAEEESGGALTQEFLSATYLQLNREYFGEEVVLDPEIALEWARIPHFYRGFYVYKYATGFSAAIAFSQRILAEEPGVQQDYLRFLAAGDSDTPLAILQKANLDMSKPQPIEEACAVFAKMLSELESKL